jgi:hypothetical protein
MIVGPPVAGPLAGADGRLTEADGAVVGATLGTVAVILAGGVTVAALLQAAARAATRTMAAIRFLERMGHLVRSRRADLGRAVC